MKRDEQLFERSSQASSPSNLLHVYFIDLNM